MQEIDLQNNVKLGDSGALSIAKHFNNIRNLNLSNVMISDIGGQKIIENLTKLLSLNISSNHFSNNF